MGARQGARRVRGSNGFVSLGKITKQKPKMWGPSIVRYGSYRYTYESGRTGEIRSRTRRLSAAWRVAGRAAAPAGQAQDGEGLPLLQAAR